LSQQFPFRLIEAVIRKSRISLFNHTALAKVFRAKMLAGIEAAGLPLPKCHPQQWVAHCKSAGTGRPALICLGRYLHRGVIRENDILAVDNVQVRFRFRFRNAKTGRFESNTAPCPGASIGSMVGEAAVDDVVPLINERQVVPSPALPLPSTANREARPAGATYRLGAQEFTVSAIQPVDRPETRMDAGSRARNLPSTWNLA
jgi:hypothetical protein